MFEVPLITIKAYNFENNLNAHQSGFEFRKVENGQCSAHQCRLELGAQNMAEAGSKVETFSEVEDGSSFNYF